MLIQARISLPDRPGALGRVGALTGSLGADIVSMQVLSHMRGRALDDLYLQVADPRRVSQLVTELAAVQGIRVHGVRESVNAPGAHPDLDLLGHVLRNPERGLLTLTDMAPAVFTADWAVLLDAGRPDVAVHASGGAPDPLPPLPAFPPRCGRENAGDMRLALARLGATGSGLVIGRNSGPPFHLIELAHMGTVVDLVLASSANRTAESVPT